MRFSVGFIFVCLLLTACSPAASEADTDPVTVHIAAAADLRPAFEELLPAWEQASGFRALVSYGSSGNFYQQISNGAPIDAFFSADVEYAQRLVDTSLTVGGVTRYALGRLVVWTRDPDIVAEFGSPSAEFRSQAPKSVKTLALANPDHAPYGRAAVAALASPALAPLAAAKLVMGDNVAHAAQMAQSGAADAGLIALSLALSPAMAGGWYQLVPADAHLPIEQAAVVLRSPRSEAAQTLVDFVNRPEGRALLARYGFEAPLSP